MSGRTLAYPWGDDDRYDEDWDQGEHNPPCPPEAHCIVCHGVAECPECSGVDCFPGDETPESEDL